jgi:hypothetical protein
VRNNEEDFLLEQSYMSTQNTNRNPNPDQYKRDWAYAARALSKGEAPEKVVQAMAAFRKDLPDPQKYAETTVTKIQQFLEVQAELKSTDAAPQAEAPKRADLKRTLKQVSDHEYARHLYEDGKDKNAVIESLTADRKTDPAYALGVAREAELRLFAERDLNYAVRAQGRGEGNNQIVANIAEYRQGKVDNPQQYAQAVVDAADRTRETERGSSANSAIEQRIQSAHEQYRRDLQFAVLQLESTPRDQVRLEIAERRPERAYDSPSFRLHGEPDPSYAVAVVQQAEKARELTDKGRSLEQVLDAAQHQFAGHVREALNAREATKPRSEVIDRISQSAPAQEFYARAVVNQAESIREQQHEMSIRPEMARAAVEQSRTATPEQTPAHTAATVER